MVRLVIQQYTREAGVRNLERSLAALARAAAVRVAEQEQAVPLSKDVHQLASPLLENRLADADGGEVEMEVIPMSVNNHEISNTFRIASPLVVDEAMLEKVLGVMISLSLYLRHTHTQTIYIHTDIHMCHYKVLLGNEESQQQGYICVCVCVSL
jgi:ATP-dependent Lon protease